MQHEEWYGGVDAGGTSSKSVVKGEGRQKRGYGKGGPANPYFVNTHRVVDNIGEGLRKAAMDAGIENGELFYTRVCAGIAGLATAEVYMEINEGLNIAYKNVREWHLLPDSVLAWYGAFGGGPGIVVIGGTGYTVHGCNGNAAVSSESEVKNENWKATVNPGARNLGYHACKMVKKHLSRGKESNVVKEWKNAFLEARIFPLLYDGGMDAALDHILASAYQHEAVVPDKDIASILPLVMGLAEKGDEDVHGLLRKAAHTVAGHVKEVASGLGFDSSYYVSLVGNAVTYPVLSRYVAEALREKTKAVLIAPSEKPLEAALELARAGKRVWSPEMLGLP